MTATKIKQSDIIARLGLTPKEIKTFRDERLSRDLHWWKEGTAIYWTEEAAAWLENSLSTAAPVEPEPAEEIIHLRIARVCPNPRFVIGDLNGFKAPVHCHRASARRLVGKTVTVRVKRHDGEVSYHYEP